MKLLLAFFAIIGSAYAMCPLSCSGHGRCAGNDRCECYKMWDGPGCDQRKCPSTIAWSDDNAGAGGSAHSYAVCGNRGICDPKSGECKCYDGFEGKGCDRMICPNNCNGRGICEKMTELYSSYGTWDHDKIQHCKCDPGWSGPGCETRMCKTGDDSMTTHTLGNAQEPNTQRITISDGSAIGGQILIKYTSWTGEEFLTTPLNAADLTAINIAEALVALPNSAIPSIEVAENTNTGTSKIFDVKFSDSSTSGAQNTLVVITAGCDLQGCQPSHEALTGTASVAHQVLGTTESLVCSGRGICDGETGDCECYTGYYGEMCQLQTAIE